MSVTIVNFQALGCQNQIQFSGAEQGDAQDLIESLINEVKRLERKFSRYLKNSLISQVNQNAGICALKLDQETCALINYCKECYHQSSGLFDITSGALSKLWDFKNKKIPTADQIYKTLEIVGWSKVIWNPPWIYLPEREMQIDLGGIGKEYAVDRLASICQEKNFKNILINLGGDIRALGHESQGRPWKIGITHPRQSNSIASHIELEEAALATSGDYERYFEVNGKRYCHIINPKTGYPVSDFQSVSIVTSSCLIAGSAASIAMLLGNGLAQNYLNTLGVKWLIIDFGGKIHSNQ